MTFSSTWHTVLELDTQRHRTSGSETALADAIRRGADLRIYTEFRHNEHIDTASDNDELVQEVSEFGVTYLVADHWSAGIMSLRQPITVPFGFGPRPSMSFFLYNQDGQQAIARPHLDGQPAPGTPGPAPLRPEPNMPRYQTLSNFDSDTNAPSINFVYGFGVYRFCVWNRWQEVFAHDAQGQVTGGSLEALVAAFERGCEIKLAIADLCTDLYADLRSDGADDPMLPHEVFVRAGPGYHYTRERLFMVGSHPVVRVQPAIPMRYESRRWDFGWLMVRSDGQVMYRRCDPYTLAFHDIPTRHAVRWLVR